MPIKIVAKYEPEEGILQFWHPEPTLLSDAAKVAEFFSEVARLIRQCPQPPYMLVDYTNLEIAVDMTQEYATQVKAYRGQVRGVFRYNLNASTEGVLTRVAVLLANKSDSNIYPDEQAAREAIGRARGQERPRPQPGRPG